MNKLSHSTLFHLLLLGSVSRPVYALVWTVDTEMVHVHGCIRSVMQPAWFGNTIFRCNHRACKARNWFAARKKCQCA